MIGKESNRLYSASLLGRRFVSDVVDGNDRCIDFARGEVIGEDCDGNHTVFTVDWSLFNQVRQNIVA